MSRLIRGLMAALSAVPMVAVAVVGTAGPANAEDNGVGATPALGWSSWSFVRHNPTAATIEAQALAMHNSGLQRAGFSYVNVDDFWYQCPGSQGPNVDQYGRWVTDPVKFPSSGTEDGVKVVADYVHSLGLRFGLYVTPGISKQAVAQNTAIQGTPYHAADIATSVAEKNYNCKGMVGIDYTKPGAQDFVDSWADEFAGWGVDYVKIDGVGTPDIPDVRAWSSALRQTGRPIHLELSNSLDINNAAVWKQYSNGWRTGGDIECYRCESGGSSYPLTAWSSVSGRFNQVANWASYGGPGAFNDYDSLEIGNGVNDGLTLDERKTQMSLWSLASSPLILGTDLTNLDKTDLRLLKNRDVLSVDQDAIDATRISSSTTTQVFGKLENANTAVVGLFNTGTLPQVVSTSASALGLPAGGSYTLDDLWAHQRTETAGTISANVPSHGVVLYRVTVNHRPPFLTPPSVVIDVAGLSALTPGTPGTVALSFTDNGVEPASWVSAGLRLPSGWRGHPTSRSWFPWVGSGQTVRTTFSVTAPVPTALFQTSTVVGWAVDGGFPPQPSSVAVPVTYTPPVVAPYRTFSSATDAPALYGELGRQIGISGAGSDLYSTTDAYSSIYLPGAAGTSSTIQTEVTSHGALTGFGKTGIMVRNNIAGSGTTPEGVILFESPSGGIQLEWSNNGGDFINSVTPPNGTIPDVVPVHLKLARAGSTYTGYYSLDGVSWTAVGSATLTGQAATQDAGMFVTSHVSGMPAQVVFNGFAVS